MTSGRHKDMGIRKKAAKLRDRGLSYESIGGKLGVTKQRVWQLLSEQGKAGEIGLKRALGPIEVFLVQEYAGLGLGSPQIAKRLGIGTNTALRYMDELGVVKTPMEKAEAKFIRPEPFGKLTVEKIVDKGGKRGYWARCRCECGNEKLVLCSNLSCDRIKSCGHCKSKRKTA